jgi:hypothetical protein
MVCSREEFPENKLLLEHFLSWGTRLPPDGENSKPVGRRDSRCLEFHKDPPNSAAIGKAPEPLFCDDSPENGFAKPAHGGPVPDRFNLWYINCCSGELSQAGKTKKFFHRKSQCPVSP